MAGDNKIKCCVDVVVVLSNATRRFRDSSYRTIRDALKDILWFGYHEEIVSCFTIISGCVLSMDIDKFVNLILRYGPQMRAVYMDGSVISNGTNVNERTVYVTSEKGVIYRYSTDITGHRLGMFEHNENLFFNRMPVPAVISPYLPFITKNSNKPDVIVSSSVQTTEKCDDISNHILPTKIQKEFQKAMLDVIRKDENISGGRILYYTIASKENKIVYMTKEDTMQNFKKIICNGPATIGFIYNKKIIVKKSENDVYDAEKAVLAMAVKSFFPDDTSYHSWMKKQMKMMNNAVETSIENGNFHGASKKMAKLDKQYELIKEKPNMTIYAKKEDTSNDVEPISTTCEERCYGRRVEKNDFARCRECGRIAKCPAINDERCQEPEPVVLKDHNGSHYTWTFAELDYLYTHYKTTTVKEMAGYLGRSEASVSTKMSKLKLPASRAAKRTSDDVCAKIKEMYLQGIRNAEISRILGMNKNTVAGIIFRMRKGGELNVE